MSGTITVPQRTQRLRNPVRKPRVKLFINCHPDPTPNAPIPPPKTCPCRSLHSTMHACTFPYKEGRVLRDLGGGWGAGSGAAIYENPGFPVSKPRVSQSQESLCAKDFAELLGELSGAICPKALVGLGTALLWYSSCDFFCFVSPFWSLDFACDLTAQLWSQSQSPQTCNLYNRNPSDKFSSCM